MPEPFFPLVLPLLYMETHLQWQGVRSRLGTGTPEIIADVAMRLEAGQSMLPVLVLVKDANLHPVIIEKVKVALSDTTGRREEREFLLDWRCDEEMQHQLIPMPIQSFSGGGEVGVDVWIDARSLATDPARFRVHNDNQPATGTALRVRIASDTWPSEVGWHCGDLHHHSSYTRDQVEFGAPPAALAALADACGCSWAAITDHSYDLDDTRGSCLTNDPALHRWQQLTADVAELNKNATGVRLILGEEVSCRGSAGQNLHLLVFNHDEFIPGTGDGAERWLYNDATLPLSEVLRRTQRSGAATYAAHPFEDGGFLQKIAFNRMPWSVADAEQEGIHGLQLWNGVMDPTFTDGIVAWLQMLARGTRIALGAGNDAHGNFGEARVATVPFFRARRDRRQIYGRARTLVFTGEPGRPSANAIVRGLSRGCSTVTNGPFVALEVETKSGQLLRPGDMVDAADIGSIHVRSQSTPEFGLVQRVTLHHGKVGGDERILCQRDEGPFELHHADALENTPGWLRASVHTPGAGEEAGLGMTNPLWIS